MNSKLIDEINEAVDGLEEGTPIKAVTLDKIMALGLALGSEVKYMNTVESAVWYHSDKHGLMLQIESARMDAGFNLLETKAFSIPFSVIAVEDPFQQIKIESTTRRIQRLKRQKAEYLQRVAEIDLQCVDLIKTLPDLIWPGDKDIKGGSIAE